MIVMLAVALPSLGACVIDDVDLGGRACPCNAPGWVCESGVCVPERALDVDGGVVDCDSISPAPLLCESYEFSYRWVVPDTRPATPEPWTQAFGRGTGSIVETSTVRAVAGTRSFRSYAAAALDTQRIATFEHKELALYTDGDLWVRTHVFVSASERTRDTTLLFLGNDMSSLQYVALALDGDGSFVLSGGSPFSYAPSTTRMARDRWTCLVLHVAIGTPGRIELFADGALAADASPESTVLTGGFRTFAIGLQILASSTDVQESVAYFDETVVSRHPLSCP